MRPKETEQWVKAASRHQCSPNEQQQESNTLETSQHFQQQSTTVQPTYHHQSSLNLPGDIFTIMHRQNEIAALVQQQQLRSLPPQDIPTFEGDPLQYRAFIKAFEQGVEEKAGKADCLYYYCLYGS